MTQETSIPAPPLAEWWQSNRFSINEACLAASNQVAGAVSIRRLLKQAAQGEVSIDDRRLRGVVGNLIAQGGETLEVIQRHRAWAKSKGGAQ